MTSQGFHLIMLILVGGLTWVSWFGYESNLELKERKILRFNAAVAIWFFYLFVAAAPGLSDFVGGGFWVLGVLSLLNIRRFIRGLDYLFVRHPAESIVSSALEANQPIDGRRLSAALGAEENGLRKPWYPTFHYQHQAEKARAVRDKLDADTELADAAIKRERTRAHQWEKPRERKERSRGPDLRLREDDRI